MDWLSEAVRVHNILDPWMFTSRCYWYIYLAENATIFLHIKLEFSFNFFSIGVSAFISLSIPLCYICQTRYLVITSFYTAASDLCTRIQRQVHCSALCHKVYMEAFNAWGKIILHGRLKLLPWAECAWNLALLFFFQQKINILMSFHLCNILPMHSLITNIHGSS